MGRCLYKTNYKAILGVLLLIHGVVGPKPLVLFDILWVNILMPNFLEEGLRGGRGTKEGFSIRSLAQMNLIVGF